VTFISHKVQFCLFFDITVAVKCGLSHFGWKLIEDVLEKVLRPRKRQGVEEAA
jgi:hypothetical protein